MDELTWISLSYATFGLVSRDGQVTQAPPIARWTIGKPVKEVTDYYRRKGAAMSALAPRPKFPTAKFATVGQSYSGVVVFPPESRQAREYNSDKLKVWPDGSPVMQTKVVLRQDDDTEVAVYAQGRMANAITDAIVKAGAPDIEVGGRLTVTFTGTDPESKNPANPAKVYTAEYIAPLGDDWDAGDLD